MTFDLEPEFHRRPESSSKVKVMGQSSRSHEKNVVKVVGLTSSDGFVVIS